MKFIPKNAGMTKSQILSMFNDYIEDLNEIAADNGVTTRVPKLKMADLTNKAAQKFVNEEYDLMEDASCCEEDLIHQRYGLVMEMIDNVMK